MIPIWKRDSAWKQDCFRFGLLTIMVTTVGCLAIVSTRFLTPLNLNIKGRLRFLNSWCRGYRLCWAELAISFLYVSNVLCLALIISRSGGLQASLYAPLLPMQFSAMLFLQIYKDQLRSEELPGGNWRHAVAYLLVAIGSFMVIVAFPDQLRDLGRFQADPKPVDYAAVSASWISGLTIAGMILTYITHWLPQQKGWVEAAEKAFERAREDKNQ